MIWYVKVNLCVTAQNKKYPRYDLCKSDHVCLQLEKLTNAMPRVENSPMQEVDPAPLLTVDAWLRASVMANRISVINLLLRNFKHLMN